MNRSRVSDVRKLAPVIGALSHKVNGGSNVERKREDDRGDSIAAGRCYV